MNRATISELDAYLAQKVQELKLSGVSVAIRGPEGVVFENGYGVRDMNKSIAPDANTICGVASMGKSMVGLSCAILAAEGKLSLQDPVSKYVPGFHVPGNPDESVTVLSLCTHSAGIPPMEPLEWSIAMNSVGRDSEWLRHMQKTAPNKMDTIGQIVEYIANCQYETLGAPGEYMSYSNEGYAVLCSVVDAASGMTLEQFLEERVFGPVGMTRSVLDEDASKARKIAADGNITALFEEEDGHLVADEAWSILPPFRGCACVKSTAHDMARYYQCLANNGMIDGAQAIPSEAVELMIGAGFALQEKPVYCLGLEKNVFEGHVVCRHSGGLHGVSSEGALFKDENYGFAVLCNEGDMDVEDLIWAMENYVLGLPLDTSHRWLKPTGYEFSAPDMLIGSYLGHEGVPSTLEVVQEDGKLIAKRDGEAADMVFCGETYFMLMRDGKYAGRLHFHIRSGKAWGVQVYTRVFQRMQS